jgi:hypothetical protein
MQEMREYIDIMLLSTNARTVGWLIEGETHLLLWRYVHDTSMHRFTAGMLLLLLHLLPHPGILGFSDPTKCRLSSEWPWLLRRTVLKLLRGDTLSKVAWEGRVRIMWAIRHRS